MDWQSNPNPITIQPKIVFTSLLNFKYQFHQLCIEICQVPRDFCSTQTLWALSGKYGLALKNCETILRLKISKILIFWIWIEMELLDWQSKSKSTFWNWIVNHNPIQQNGLQSGLANPAIQSSNTLIISYCWCNLLSNSFLAKFSYI